MLERINGCMGQTLDGTREYKAPNVPVKKQPTRIAQAIFRNRQSFARSIPT